MLQDAADEVQRFLRQVRILVTRKERLAVFPDGHVHVHAGAVVARDGFRHEGCRLAVRRGHIVDHIFVLLQLVRLFGQAVKDQTQLVLTGRNLVVVLVHFHTQTLHCAQHLGAQVLAFVRRVHREVAAFDTRTVAHIAHFVFGIRVPGGVCCIDLIGHFVDRVAEAHIIKQEELRFRTHIGHIADAGGFQIGFRLLCRAAWVALIGFAGVWFHNRAVQADSLFRIERIDISAVCVGHQFHVGGFDGFPTRDGGAVKHEALIQKVFVHLIAHHRDVLQFPARVGETDIDILDILVLDHLEQGFCAHVSVPFGLVSWLLLLQRVRTGFPGADADGLFDAGHENLAVADLFRLGRIHDRFDRGVNLIVV